MDDLIQRQAVLDALRARFGVDFDHGKWWSSSHVLAAIESVPGVKLGHWEWVQYDSSAHIGNWHCSECRRIVLHMPEKLDNTPTYKWCPMCGARMQEVKG